MKKTFHHRLSIFVLSAVILYGCSELKNGAENTNPMFVYVHPDGFRSPSSPNFHGNAIQAANWEIRTCRQCHGGAYTGGNAISCEKSGCHVDASGNVKSPESCNTCHGLFSADPTDTLSWAPPRSTAGDTSTSAHGVGAHQTHLLGTGSGSLTSVPCAGCHSIPSGVYSAGHINTQATAQVIITSSLATLPSGGIVPSPSYNAQTLQCGNTFCHGTWRLRKSDSKNPLTFTDSVIVGANFSPQWTGGGSQAACGSCHGLPPTGHFNYGASCTTCHYYTDPNTQAKAQFKSTHINGKIDLYGDEYPFK